MLDSPLTRVIVILAIFLSLLSASGGLAGQETSAVEQLAQEGWSAVDAQRFGEALTAFDAAIELAPREPTLWFGAGAAAFMLGRDDQARESLEHALSLDPRLVSRPPGCLASSTIGPGRSKRP